MLDLKHIDIGYFLNPSATILAVSLLNFAGFLCMTSVNQFLPKRISTGYLVNETPHTN